jgi:hypothetical protein
VSGLSVTGLTDYKELCAELVTELEGWCGTGTYDNTVNAHSVIDRARAWPSGGRANGHGNHRAVEKMSGEPITMAK